MSLNCVMCLTDPHYRGRPSDNAYTIIEGLAICYPHLDRVVAALESDPNSTYNKIWKAIHGPAS